jgi:hypothetical protein
LFRARDVRPHPGGDIEFIECAQYCGTGRAGLVPGRDEMCLRCFGRPASVMEFVEQIEFDIAALVFGFRQRLHVVGGFEMHGGFTERQYRRAPGRGVRPRDEFVALAERHVAEQSFVDGEIRRRSRPPQDAHRRGPTPRALVDARHRNAHRCRLLEANYSAMEPMAEVRIGKFGVLFARVDLDAHVDIAFANLDHVNARPQLADQRLHRGALDDQIGRILDQGFGLEAARTPRKAKQPGNA